MNMPENDTPLDGTFFIDQAMGLSNTEYDAIVTELLILVDSNMGLLELVEAVVKGRNSLDVMMGFKLAILVYASNKGL